MLQKWPSFYLVLATKLGSLRVSQVVLDLKALRDHEKKLRLDCERPREAIGETGTCVAIEGPGLKESCRDVEAQDHEASLREAVAQLQQKTLAFWSFQYHGRTTTNTSSCGVELARAWKTNRVCCNESSQKSEPPLEENSRWYVGPSHWTFHYLHC